MKTDGERNSYGRTRQRPARVSMIRVVEMQGGQHHRLNRLHVRGEHDAGKQGLYLEPPPFLLLE
jgi:hypothetical protein